MRVVGVMSLRPGHESIPFEEDLTPWYSFRGIPCRSISAWRDRCLRERAWTAPPGVLQARPGLQVQVLQVQVLQVQVLEAGAAPACWGLVRRIHLRRSVA